MCGGRGARAGDPTVSVSLHAFQGVKRTSLLFECAQQTKHAPFCCTTDPRDSSPPRPQPHHADSHVHHKLGPNFSHHVRQHQRSLQSRATTASETPARARNIAEQNGARRHHRVQLPQCTGAAAVRHRGHAAKGGSQVCVHLGARSWGALQAQAERCGWKRVNGGVLAPLQSLMNAGCPSSPPPSRPAADHNNPAERVLKLLDRTGSTPSPSNARHPTSLPSVG